MLANERDDLCKSSRRAASWREPCRLAEGVLAVGDEVLVQGDLRPALTQRATRRSRGRNAPDQSPGISPGSGGSNRSSRLAEDAMWRALLDLWAEVKHAARREPKLLETFAALDDAVAPSSAGARTRDEEPTEP